MKQYGIRGAAIAMSLAGMMGSAFAQDTPAVGDAAPAAATMAKKIVKPKKAKAKALPVVMVAVSNMRSVGLVELDVAMAGSADSKRIAGPLAAGKKVNVKVEHDKACLFDIHGAFDDGTTTDAPSVDLCKEKKINLVE